MGGLGREMLEHFPFRKGELRGGFPFGERDAPPLLARGKFHPQSKH